MKVFEKIFDVIAVIIGTIFFLALFLLIVSTSYQALRDTFFPDEPEPTSYTNYDSAYFEAYHEGYDEGYDYGYSVGDIDGYIEGYDEGYSDGIQYYRDELFLDEWEEYLFMDYGITESELCELLGFD